jgi:hypothetical protein
MQVDDTGFSLISIKPGTISTGVTGPLTTTELPAAPKKKRKRKGKVVDENGNEEEIVETEPLPFSQSNIPYHDTYAETDAILRRSIDQLDAVTASMYEDIQSVRNSKTLRKKYDYISDMNSTMVSSIQAKIQAARELNNSIKNSHELDLKRMKELKLNEANQDDAKSIMDMYQAFVSTPVSQNITGPFTSPLGASTIDLTLPNGMMNNAMMGQNPEIQYNNFVNNMTPEQMTMMIEDNPNINHVVTYDPSSGQADFAVYDKSTGQFLNNVPTRDREMFMDSMTFNFETMQAHDRDLNENYDIIYVNTPGGAGEVPLDTISDSGKDMGNY